LSSRRIRAGGLAAGLAAAAAVVLAVFAPWGGAGGDGVTGAWAAEAIEVAESAPRILIDRPGWTIERADEFSARVGEVTFSDGQHRLDLHWRPASTHEDYVDDRAHSSDEPRDVRVLGHAATLFQYSGTTDFTTLWRDGDHSLEARGNFPDREQYLEVLGSLREVGVNAWLSAMPASVVRPADREAVVAEMLEGIPLPPGLDAGAVQDFVAANGGTVADRYQLGARVVQAVACSWFDRWAAALDAGDTATAEQAAAAMATSPSWPVLLEMDSEGDYPEFIWAQAEGMRDPKAQPSVRGNAANEANCP
jgi:hypothetical protein